MKKLMFMLLISSHVFAQNVDYNKIILPDNVKSADFAERLVQLAWKNHPTNEVFRREIAIANNAVKKNAGQWLDVIRISGNLNEFTIDPASAPRERAMFYPRYNIGASVSLGMFVTIPYNTKMDRQRVVVAESQLDAQKLETRNIVMKTYNDYLLSEKIYRLQAQVFADIENTHKLMEQRFKNGETTFETYSLSQENFSRASIVLLEAEAAYKNRKLDLEKLIGLKLEDVR